MSLLRMMFVVVVGQTKGLGCHQNCRSSGEVPCDHSDLVIGQAGLKEQSVERPVPHSARSS